MAREKEGGRVGWGQVVEKVGRREAVAWCLADVWTRAWYRLAQSQHENICLRVFLRGRKHEECGCLPERKINKYINLVGEGVGGLLLLKFSLDKLFN